MKIPGPDHPITIVPHDKSVTVHFDGRKVAQTHRALRLREASYPPVLYIPRADADMTAFVATDHHTHCPFKGEASYFTLAVNGRRTENAVWSFEDPYPAVAAIKDHLAFYPDRVDAIEEE